VTIFFAAMSWEGDGGPKCRLWSEGDGCVDSDVCACAAAAWSRSSPTIILLSGESMNEILA